MAMPVPHSVLQSICAHKRQEIATLKSRADVDQLTATLKPAAQGFLAALQQPPKATRDVHIIAELKPSSPAAGVLQAKLNVLNTVSAYNAYASALSVLTDAQYFGGSFGLLRQVKDLTALPVLCKDFILDPLQVLLARQAGADAVLLIVKALPDETLHALYALIQTWGMTPVVEVQNPTELTRALALNPEVLLINHRNLDTLAMDMDTVLSLVPQIPSQQNPIVIAASGIECRADLQRLLPATRHFLVGTSLMKSPDPQATLASLVGHQP
jgi:indole-3-glycerol phosphate synthase